MERTWDCIVVGGGAAGLSAALVLGRARRRTLLLDAGHQSNLAAHGIGGLLGYDQRPPGELYAAGRRELEAYPTVEVRRAEVVAGRRDDAGFSLELAGGGRESARRLVLATGMDYRHPDLPGIGERWGRSVFHCPFCHGWEVRGRSLGVLDPGETGVHRALLLRAWSDDVTLFAPGVSDADAARLRDAGVQVEARAVEGLRGPGDELEAVILADGAERPCEGLLVAVTLHQRSSLAFELGAELAAPNPVVADAVEVDARGATTVPGLAAAGDAAAQMPSITNAIASGSLAAASVMQSLLGEF